MFSIAYAQSGIYAIVNKINGKRYIGSASNIRNRWYAHQMLLRNGNHHSIHLQRAWSKYGENNFSFIVVEYCDKSALIQREQYHFNTMQPEYNTAKFALTSMLGSRHTASTITKISTSHKGITHSDEARKKMSLSRRGVKRQPHTEETKLKMSLASKGKPKSIVHKLALALAKLGKKRGRHSDTHRKNLSISIKKAVENLDRSKYKTPEYRAKQSAQMKKVWATRKKEK